MIIVKLTFSKSIWT